MVTAKGMYRGAFGSGNVGCLLKYVYCSVVQEAGGGG